MLDHVSITVTDIGAAEKFYDAVMGVLGVPKVRKSQHRLGYGERCDGDHPTEITCRSRVVIGQMMLQRGIGASKRLVGQRWMHFGAPEWRTEERIMVLRAFATFTTPTTTRPS